jgi:hypothetical protein
MARQDLLIPIPQARAFLTAVEETGGIIEVETPIGTVRFFPSKYGEEILRHQSQRVQSDKEVIII